MDGLLVDSEPVWTLAEQELAASLGGVFTGELKAAVVGTRLDVAVPTILRWYGRAATPEEVATTSAWLLHRMVELFAGDLPVRPGRSRAARRPARARGPGRARVVVLPGARRRRARPRPRAVRPHGRRRRGGARQAAPRAVPDGGCPARRRPGPVRGAGGLAGRGGAGEAAGCAVVAVPSVAGVAFAPRPRRLVVGTLAGLTRRRPGRARRPDTPADAARRDGAAGAR